MNNEKDERTNEALIREFSESSKRLRTPEGLRDSNRRHIENALHSANTEVTAPGWLKKRISVPLPVAAGLLLILCLQLTFQCFGLRAYFLTPKETTSNDTNSTVPAEEPLQLQYSEQTTYVCGMGFAEKLKNYTYIKESNYEGN